MSETIFRTFLWSVSIEHLKQMLKWMDRKICTILIYAHYLFCLQNVSRPKCMIYIHEHQQIATYLSSTSLTLNAPIATKVVCFSLLQKCLRSLYGKQCGPSSGSTLFASILNSSVMLGNFLQQTTSADNIFRCFFFLAL